MRCGLLIQASRPEKNCTDGGGRQANRANGSPSHRNSRLVWGEGVWEKGEPAFGHEVVMPLGRLFIK